MPCERIGPGDSSSEPDLVHFTLSAPVTQGGFIVTLPAKSEIQRVFCILPNETKIEKKINHSEGAENIDFTY